jgi:DNA-binding Lrp family transcriptional regulator
MDAAHRLDRIDRRILVNLQAEGRLTNHELAKRVALSPSACLARVRRLEKAGVIEGYHARLDPFVLDIGLVLFAEVTLKAHGATDLARFEAGLARFEQIVEASHVSGAFDYLLKVVVADMTEWNAIAQDLTASDIGGERVNTHVLMDKPKKFIGFPVRT